MRQSPHPKIIITAATALLVFSLCAMTSIQVRAQQLPLDRITGQIEDGVSSILRLPAPPSSNKNAVSLGALIIDLGRLSGQERALAFLIDSLAANPASGHGGGAIMDELNTSLNSIRATYATVDRDLSLLDPEWAQTHPLLQIDLGNFAHDGALFYCIISCSGPLWSGGPAIMITNPAQATQLAGALRYDVATIESIAVTLQQGNASPKAVTP